MSILMNRLGEEQISIIEKQCGYVPLLMNRSKAVRSYIIGVFLKFILFILLCALYKWNENFLPLLIVYSIFLIVHTYVRAFTVLNKHMINHLDKAEIHASGVVVEKRHVYPQKLINFVRRQTQGARAAKAYSESYFAEIKVLMGPQEEAWFPCTRITYERAVAGDPVLVLKFPEEYELGSFCCFLASNE